jgi:hypothetical protein
MLLDVSWFIPPDKSYYIPKGERESSGEQYAIL